MTPLKKFEEFIFNGDWEFSIQLPAFAGFRKQYVSDDVGILRVTIEDDLSDTPDPSPEQLLALRFIFENQEAIAQAAIERTAAELPEIVTNYGLEHEPVYQNPNEEQIRSLINFSSITIKLVSKKGVAYFDLTGNCSWDDDHGLELLFHRGQVISYGDISGNTFWDAVTDNGTYEVVKDQMNQPSVPKIYQPHPKYNKLKPAQQDANETYEYNLISHGHNDLFIAGVDNGTIDVHGKYVNQDKTWLEAACWFKNNALVKYLLSKNVAFRYALHQCMGFSENPEAFELLLQTGADINATYRDGKTVLFILLDNMEGFYRSKRFYETNGYELPPDLLQVQRALRERIADLIRRGADPFIKNMYGYNCFDIMRNANANDREDLHRFLNKCLQG